MMIYFIKGYLNFIPISWATRTNLRLYHRLRKYSANEEEIKGVVGNFIVADKEENWDEASNRLYDSIN